MSAYIVEQDNLYRIINILTKIEGYTKQLKEIKEDAISKPKSLFKKLNTLNRYSISQRYKDDPLTDKMSYDFNLNQLNKISINTNRHQGLKSLKCFLYQSCEGQASKSDLYRLLDEISNDVCYDIVQSSKQYEQSIWG